MTPRSSDPNEMACHSCRGYGAVWYDPEGFWETCDECNGKGRVALPSAERNDASTLTAKE